MNDTPKTPILHYRYLNEKQIEKISPPNPPTIKYRRLKIDVKTININVKKIKHVNNINHLKDQTEDPGLSVFQEQITQATNFR